MNECLRTEQHDSNSFIIHAIFLLVTFRYVSFANKLTVSVQALNLYCAGRFKTRNVTIINEIKYEKLVDH